MKCNTAHKLQLYTRAQISIRSNSGQVTLLFYFTSNHSQHIEFYYTYQILLFFSCGSTVLEDPDRLACRRFLELCRHMVGLLGRVISPSQGLYLHRTTQHRKTRDKLPCFERDSNPRSQQPTGQDPRLRPRGHCDRQILLLYCGKYARVLNLSNIICRYVFCLSPYQMPGSNSLLFIVVRLKPNENSSRAAVLFYMQQKITLTQVAYFQRSVTCIVSGSCIERR
jgi:hypothetical protein